MKKLTPKQKAIKIYDSFSNNGSANAYITLWQDEYINEEDRIYRQQTKEEFLKLCI